MRFEVLQALWTRIARPGPSRAMWVLAIFSVAVLIMVVLSDSASAADGPPPDSTRLFLPSSQLLVAIVGSLVPLVTYVLNHYAPWISEPAKALFLALVAAAAGALATLVDTGGIAVDWETAQLVGTAVVMAFLSHLGFWRPSGISAWAGGGSNAQAAPTRRASDRAAP